MKSLENHLCLTILLLHCASHAICNIWEELLLPEGHISHYFYSRPELQFQCLKDTSCPYKSFIEKKVCWGYEDKCLERHMQPKPSCPYDAPKGWASTKQEQIDSFWRYADFGYIKKRKQNIKALCVGENEDDSSLVCASHMRFCKASNLYIDFTNFTTGQKRSRYDEYLFTSGQIGGFCTLNKPLLEKQGDHRSPLQSWYAELEQYSSLQFKPSNKEHCDITLNGPVIFIKLDAGVNMYHHFCDFVNLYMSQHLNGSFSMDVQIVMWDASTMRYGDFFHDTWKAFSKHPIKPLMDFAGKRVCVKDAMFPFLARMRYGLYYNTPMIPGCKGSNMFQAFADHILHRLRIIQYGPLRNKIRVTLLSRSTKYRTILNQHEIVNALKTIGEYDVKVVDYNRNMPFLEQLEITYNSDIFMGMHGAGLTHLLFQPDWGQIFEIYNCEDVNCYRDLARIRGMDYHTWEKDSKLFPEDEGHHPQLGAHKKFTNYTFDLEEFLRIVDRMAKNVRKHPKFKKAWEAKYSNKDEL